MNAIDSNDVFDLSRCRLCPRLCGADRLGGGLGRCRMGAEAGVALAEIHRWEEPVICGGAGAGAVFFAGCSLGCVYCQNYEISGAGGTAKTATTEHLACIFLDLQAQNAATLDLVTPTHFYPRILPALRLAKSRGLRLPVVCNTSGYERLETVAAVAADIDIFLSDFKYISPATAGKYSAAPDYPATALQAIAAMLKAKGRPAYFDPATKTRLQSGVIVRHLVLPGHRKESIAAVKALYENFGDDIILSLLRQYTPLPTPRLAGHKNLQRRLTTFEYESVAEAAYDAGFRQAFVQEKGCADAGFIPNFKAD